MTDFTPISALAGGALIGLSAALLMLLNGRIAGISGILGDFLSPRSSFRDWQLAFVAGLLAAPAIYLTGGIALPAVAMPHWPVLIVAGLLIGFGTRLGSGCTSGHGVCGVARLSPRSITATAIFMLA